MRYWTEHSTNVWEVGNLYNFSKKTQKMSLEGRKTVVGSEETTASEGNGLKQRPNIFCLPSKTCIFLRNPFSKVSTDVRPGQRWKLGAIIYLWHVLYYYCQLEKNIYICVGVHKLLMCPRVSSRPPAVPHIWQIPPAAHVIQLRRWHRCTRGGI